MKDYFPEARVPATLTEYLGFQTGCATRKILFNAHHRAAIKPISEENGDTESKACQVSNVIAIIPPNPQSGTRT